ncbi:MAG: ATP synthase F0 subunit B [Eubacteriales bacterium]|nr:ATP synthase F0 subunit B [Eubacteriales bacterium]
MLRLDWNLAFTVLNLLIWYALIRFFLFKPVNKIISKREEAINARYDDARKLQDEAQAEKEKCEQFQAQIEEEKTKVMAQAQESARAEYDQIVSDAKKKAASIVDASKKDAELQKQKIIGKAEQEIRSLILDAAVKTMQSEHSDGALYDQFLTKAGETTHEEA